MLLRTLTACMYQAFGGAWRALVKHEQAMPKLCDRSRCCHTIVACTVGMTFEPVTPVHRRVDGNYTRWCCRSRGEHRTAVGKISL
jgi:hypothetical protein